MISEDILRKKRLNFRGGSPDAIANVQMQQQRSKDIVQAQAAEEAGELTAVPSSEDPFSMWAKQMMPSENSYSTYDTHHHNEKRFTDVLR